ncbi:MAG: PfkB family carbohydrate kinase [Solirubrobacteraceae bacterium]
MPTSAATLAVFAPSPLVTVTIEKSEGDAAIHFHAGGQGVWVARLAGAMGARVMLATTLGGESGRVLSAVLDAPGVVVHAVPIASANGAYVHDRRSGRRRVVIEVPAPRLQRHEADDLYGVALADALAAGTCCLTGPQHPGVLDPDMYRRLAGDLRRNDVTVIADLTGPALTAALQGGIDVLKLSARELVETGWATSDDLDDLVRSLPRLRGAGARTVIASRGAQGALVLAGERLLLLDGLSLTSADPHGSGASTVAALAVSLAGGRSLEDALRVGAAAGALNATRHGLGTGTRAEIEQLARAVRLTGLADPVSLP